MTLAMEVRAHPELVARVRDEAREIGEPFAVIAHRLTTTHGPLPLPFVPGAVVLAEQVSRAARLRVLAVPAEATTALLQAARAAGCDAMIVPIEV